MPFSRSIRFAVAVGVAAVLATSCRDSTGPATGSIRISISTTGTDIDPDGYSVTLDGEASRIISANAELTISGVSAGDHSVTLSGLASNCTASPGLVISPAVSAGGRVTAAFQVVCVPRVGTVIVTTITTGADPDADGYLLAVEGTGFKPIASTSVDTITSVPEGNRALLLTGLANNCVVVASASLTIGVVFKDTARVGLSVNCVARRGVIRVAFSSTGNDLDTAFAVQIDAGPPTTVKRTVVLDVADIAEGVHTVTLSGVEGNCSVAGPNPRPVSVVHGQTALTTFVVTCVEKRAAVRVTTLTTGVERDPNGYTLYYQSYYTPTLSRSLPLNGNTVIGDLRLDDTYTFWLVDIERNCTLSSPVYRTLPPLTYGDTVHIDLSVNCVTSGTLQLNVATSGVEIDANYWLRITAPNIDTTAMVPANGSVSVPKLGAGDYLVTLYDVAANCEVVSNPRTVAFGTPGITVSTFAVQCGPLQDLAYVSTQDGEIYVVKSNGTGATRLTHSPYSSSDQPAWSPDGSKIAFRSQRDGNEEIYVMNADGSNVVRLTNSAAADMQPAWSPDGTRIVFASERSGNAEIHVMNSDGTNVVRLTNNAAIDMEPAWSPDGLHIAFRSQRDGNAEIYTMTPDGNAQTRVTFNELSDIQPAWSPDGLKIAFSRGVCDPQYGCNVYRIHTISPSGGSLTRVTSGFQDYNPSWAPDGSQIAYTSDYCDDYGCSPYVWAVPVVGQTSTFIVGYASDPHWRP